MDKSGVWIVIAAYNEEHSIANVIRSLKSAGFENVVVTDDGSRDKTFGVASKLTPQALRRVINRGQGAALKTGIDYSIGNGAKVIVTFDADGQHRVEDLPAMIGPVASGKVDITLGSRFLKEKSDIPLIRKLFLKGGV